MLNENDITMLDGSTFALVHNDYPFIAEGLSNIGEKYNAKYLGQFNLNKEPPAWLFYTEEPHPKGSNYFKIFTDTFGKKVYITNGLKEADHTWIAVVDPEKKVALYSGHIHDYQTFDDLMIDGGSAHYTRQSLSPTIKFKIIDGKFMEVSDEP